MFALALPSVLPPVPLRDGSVSLRRPGRADAQTVSAYRQQADATGWLSARQTPFDVDDLLREFLAGWNGVHNRLGLTIVVEDAADLFVGVFHLWESDGGLEVSYGVAPGHRMKGIATRSLTLVSEWALGSGGYSTVQLEIAVDNAASRRVAEKCAFTAGNSRTTRLAGTREAYTYLLYTRGRPPS